MKTISSTFLKPKYFLSFYLGFESLILICEILGFIDMLDAMLYTIQLACVFMILFGILIAFNDNESKIKKQTIVFNKKSFDYSELSKEFKEKYTFKYVDDFLSEVRNFKVTDDSK